MAQYNYADDPFFSYLDYRTGYSPETGSTFMSDAQAQAQYDQRVQDAIAARSQSGEAQGYGTAGLISRFSTNTPWSDLGFNNPGIKPGQVAPFWGQEDAFNAFQQKYPGYAQVASLQVGAGPGSQSNIRQYVNDGARVYDPTYGWIAPVSQTGYAGKDPIPYMKAGGAVLAAMAAAAGGAALAGGGAAGAGGATGEAGAAAGTGATGSPLFGPGALIPDYTMGIGSNAGAFGAGVTDAGAFAPGLGAQVGSLGWDIPSWTQFTPKGSMPSFGSNEGSGKSNGANGMDLSSLFGGSGGGGWGSVIGAGIGALGGIFGNKQQGPSLAQNQADMSSLFGQANALGAAQSFRGLGPQQYYPGQTVADFSPQTQQALAALYGRGANGSPAVNAASGYLQNALGGGYLNSSPATAGLTDIAGRAGSSSYNPAMGYFTGATNGQYLNGNPYLDAMYGAASRNVTDQFRNSIAPSLASTFSAAGRTGSGAAQGAFGQATQSLGNTLGDLGANLYGNAYSQERQLQQAAAGQLGSLYNQGIQNQLNALGQLSTNYNVERGLQNAAAGMAPANAQAGYQDINAMLQAGQLYDAHAQDLLNAQKARFDFEQNAPRDFLSQYIGLLQGIPRAQIQGQQPQPYNTLAGGLGGALVGSRIAGMFGGNGGGNAGAIPAGSDLAQQWDPYSLRSDMSAPLWG